MTGTLPPWRDYGLLAIQARVHRDFDIAHGLRRCCAKTGSGRLFTAGPGGKLIWSAHWRRKSPDCGSARDGRANRIVSGFDRHGVGIAADRERRLHPGLRAASASHSGGHGYNSGRFNADRLHERTHRLARRDRESGIASSRSAAGYSSADCSWRSATSRWASMLGAGLARPAAGTSVLPHHRTRALNGYRGQVSGTLRATIGRLIEQEGAREAGGL